MDRASEAQHEAASPRLAGNIEKRDRRAEERDHLAERRDRAAEERDRAAEASGSLAEEIEREMAAGSTQVDAALKVAARWRSFAGLTSMTSPR